jgi:hypothetical protein
MLIILTELTDTADTLTPMVFELQNESKLNDEIVRAVFNQLVGADDEAEEYRNDIIDNLMELVSYDEAGLSATAIGNDSTYTISIVDTKNIIKLSV